MFKLGPTVDGWNPATQLRLLVYPIINRVLYTPGGCLGFLPSTVISEQDSTTHGFSVFTFRFDMIKKPTQKSKQNLDRYIEVYG